MIRSATFVISALLFFILLAQAAFAQPAHPRQSPIDISRTMLGDTYIKVVYGKPYARDREIFGELVPFGAVWRTGANEATEILFTEPVVFGGQTVEDGIYSLFTIPKEETWTIILNRQLGAWGGFRYDQSLDVLRIEVPVERLEEHQEAFQISFATQEEPLQTTMSLSWEKTRVSVPITRP